MMDHDISREERRKSTEKTNIASYWPKSCIAKATDQNSPSMKRKPGNIGEDLNSAMKTKDKRSNGTMALVSAGHLGLSAESGAMSPTL